MRFLITPELDGIGIYPCSINAHFNKAFIEKAGRSIGYFPRAARINRLDSTGYDVRLGTFILAGCGAAYAQVKVETDRAAG